MTWLGMNTNVSPVTQRILKSAQGMQKYGEQNIPVTCKLSWLYNTPKERVTSSGNIVYWQYFTGNVFTITITHSKNCQWFIAVPVIYIRISIVTAAQGIKIFLLPNILLSHIYHTNQISIKYWKWPTS